jgi:hypothetical protein
MSRPAALRRMWNFTWSGTVNASTVTSTVMPADSYVLNIETRWSAPHNTQPQRCLPTALARRLFNRVARCPTCGRTLLRPSDILQAVVTL